MSISSIKKNLTDDYAVLAKRNWWKFLMRWQTNVNNHYVGLVAAGIAFYFLMAAFPAIGGAISIYGLIADPSVIANHMNSLGRFLPHDALQILSEQAKKITDAGNETLSLSLVISILLTIYSTTQGAKALITGCNIAYNLHETRNFIKLNLTAYILTLFLVMYFLTALTLVAGLPALVSLIPYAPFAKILLLLRWPMLFVIALFGLAVFYFFAPNREKREWHWISPGAAMATAMWVLFSSLFSLYVSHFGKYNETYGSLGAVIILLLWFWLTAMTILYGAEFNATMEEADGSKPKAPAAMDQAPQTGSTVEKPKE